MQNRSLAHLYDAYARTRADQTDSSKRKPTAIQIYTGRSGSVATGGFKRMEACRQALDAIDRSNPFIFLFILINSYFIDSKAESTAGASTSASSTTTSYGRARASSGKRRSRERSRATTSAFWRRTGGPVCHKKF